MVYSEIISRAIMDCLEEGPMELVEFDEDCGAYRFLMHICGTFSFIPCFIIVEQDSFTVGATCPIAANSNNAREIAKITEFVESVNSGLQFGGRFEMLKDSGEIRYRYKVACGNIAPDDRMVNNSIFVSVSMINRYSHGMVGILFEGMNLDQALTLCEEENLFHRELDKLMEAGAADLSDTFSTHLLGKFQADEEEMVEECVLQSLGDFLKNTNAIPRIHLGNPFETDDTEDEDEWPDE